METRVHEKGEIYISKTNSEGKSKTLEFTVPTETGGEGKPSDGDTCSGDNSQERIILILKRFPLLPVFSPGPEVNGNLNNGIQIEIKSWRLVFNTLLSVKK